MICFKLGKEVDGEDVEYVMNFMKRNDVEGVIQSYGSQVCVDESTLNSLMVMLHDVIDTKLRTNEKTEHVEINEITATSGFIADAINKITATERYK